MITLKAFVFNSFQENTFLLHDDTGNCIIIDPGMNSPEERKQLVDYISEHKLKPEAIVNTHCHVDHVLSCSYLKNLYQIPFYCHELEVELLETAKDYGEFFGLNVDPPPHPDRYLNDDEEFQFGESKIKLIHVPGHSQGSLSLYSENDKFVITGDALFKGGVGRSDLPGGDHQTLINAIRARLLTLPRDVEVYPGHGSSTSIGEEYDTNPFLN